MKQIDLGQKLTILANAGVIAGIIFLGVELQQNNELMESEARRNRSAFAEEANLMIAADGEFASLILKDIQGEPLSATETLRVSRYWFAGLINLEVGYFDLTPEALESQANRWRGLFELNPTLREFWASNTLSFDPEFVTWIDDSVLAPSE